MGLFSFFSCKKNKEEVTQATDNGLCPKCGRAHYRAEGGLEDHYCKWCGVVFKANGKIVPDVKFRPADYFRNIWDIKNVSKYETITREENKIFHNYIFNNFSDCEIIANAVASQITANAPEYAMPINFLISKGDKRIAVLLVDSDKCKRYSVLETMELCKENDVVALRFLIEFPNEEEYVVKRIRTTLEQ